MTKTIISVSYLKCSLKLFLFQVSDLIEYVRISRYVLQSMFKSF